MNKGKDNSKSLFLYTGLIFLVALVMIIISFFGQSNLEKTNQAIQDQKSISEKSAALSEENMKLVEKNLEIERQSAEKDEKIKALSEEIAIKEKTIEQHDFLLQAYSYYSVGDVEKAKAALDSIAFDELDGDAKILYTQIINDINKRKED